jgi:acyl dehydratase
MFLVSPERTVAYAEATNDPIPEHRSGELAPPVFAIVPAWEALVEATTSVVPPEMLPLLVHGEHDIRIHQPIAPGMRLHTDASVVGVLPKSSGTSVVVHAVTRLDDGTPVNEQYLVSFVRAFSVTPSGSPAPGHTFDESARATTPRQVTAHIDDDQTFRYAEASGDPMPIHLDDEVARAVGLPGIIVHGLCTMAFASWACISVAGGDPRRLRRLAVRFSRPVLPGQDITTSIWPGQSFETVSSAGDVVIRNGLAVFG